MFVLFKMQKKIYFWSQVILIGHTPGCPTLFFICLYSIDPLPYKIWSSQLCEYTPCRTEKKFMLKFVCKSACIAHFTLSGPGTTFYLFLHPSLLGCYQTYFWILINFTLSWAGTTFLFLYPSPLGCYQTYFCSSYYGK